MFRPQRERDRIRRFSEPATAITRNALASALASARSAYPNEFGGLLRLTGPRLIGELLLLPGTTAGRRHANFQLWMLPADVAIVGTVHSHPSGAVHPSEADLQLFRHWGRRHLILGYPYSERDWLAYDGNGRTIPLTVVDGPRPVAPPAPPRDRAGR